MTIAQTISLVRTAFAHETFTTAEAQAHGIGPDRLERATTAGALHRLHKGVYALHGSGVPEAWGLASCRVRQLGQRGVPAVIAGPTSSDWWDIPVVGARPDAEALTPTLYVDPASGVRDGIRDGVRVVHAKLTPQDVWESAEEGSSNVLARPPVCMPLRSAVDVTRHLRLAEPAAVAALSAAQRRHAAILGGHAPRPTWHAGPDGRPQRAEGWRVEADLTEELQHARLRGVLREELLGTIRRTPRRGLRYVRDALPYVDPRLETALEAISWSFLCRSGLPLPRLQQWVTGASGKRYRVDFFWPEFRLIGEADGAMKYRSADDIMAEKDRHADLADAGHGLVRWTWHDAWVARVFLARIEREMDRARR